MTCQGNDNRRISRLPLWLFLSECWLFAAPPSAPLMAGLVQRSSINISTSFCLLQPSSSRLSSVLAASSFLLRSSVWAAPCDICEVKRTFQINISNPGTRLCITFHYNYVFVLEIYCICIRIRHFNSEMNFRDVGLAVVLVAN